jgi:hypothetical protein
VTNEDRARWDEGHDIAWKAWILAQENAGRITDLEGRVSHLELSLYNDITANRFDISFGNLDGIKIIYGIWNPVQHRVEC